MKHLDISFSEIAFGSPEYSEEIKLRDLVLRVPLDLEFYPEDLSTEYDSIHLIGSINGQIAAAMVLKPVSDDIIKMRQVAVHPEYQNMGVGGLFVQYAESVAIGYGYKEIELNARLVACEFYERLGYSKVGDQFEEVNIPHFRMEKLIGQ